MSPKELRAAESPRRANISALSWSLADIKSIPNRGTIAVNRQRAYARTETNIIGEFPGITSRRNTQNRMHRPMSKGRNIIRIRRRSKLSNI